MSSEIYEFDQQQNVTLATLAHWMKRTGQCLYAYGSIQVMGLLVSLPSQLGLFGQATLLSVLAFINIALLLLMVSAHFAIGYWTISAAGAFSRVVETSGNDLPYLMHALDNLRKTFGLIVNILISLLVWMAVYLAVFSYVIQQFR